MPVHVDVGPVHRNRAPVVRGVRRRDTAEQVLLLLGGQVGTRCGGGGLAAGRGRVNQPGLFDKSGQPVLAGGPGTLQVEGAPVQLQNGLAKVKRH